uniref:Uncharacterized protein n=1 Tax=Alexandrium catenella TaxID=2925 RepID=A0A7S1MG92_ALECA|mmetsp:Transcript_26245/g.71326  ORF Transcript_26245/g.71326 Transcript_26245/m.71326 type:complete len:178 (+) Transcript_26245:96-629(+)
MSSLSPQELPAVTATKTYTVTCGMGGGLGFFFGMTVGQLGAFFGCFFSGSKDGQGNWQPNWWALCFLGNAITGIQGLTNPAWFPARVRRHLDGFEAVSVAGCTARIPFDWIETVSVGETCASWCSSRKAPCAVITLNELGVKSWNCGCCPSLRQTRIKYCVDEWDQFLADNGLSAHP